MWFQRAAGESERGARSVESRRLAAGGGSFREEGRRQSSRRRPGELGALASDEADSPPESPPLSTLVKVDSRRSPAGRLEAVSAERALPGERELTRDRRLAGERELSNRELATDRELASEPTDTGMAAISQLGAG